MSSKRKHTYEDETPEMENEGDSLDIEDEEKSLDSEGESLEDIEEDLDGVDNGALRGNEELEDDVIEELEDEEKELPDKVP